MCWFGLVCFALVQANALHYQKANRPEPLGTQELGEVQPDGLQPLAQLHPTPEILDSHEYDLLWIVYPTPEIKQGKF